MSVEAAKELLRTYYPDNPLIIKSRVFERESEFKNEYCFDAYSEGEDSEDSCYWLVAKDLSSVGALLE